MSLVNLGFLVIDLLFCRFRYQSERLIELTGAAFLIPLRVLLCFLSYFASMLMFTFYQLAQICQYSISKHYLINKVENGNMVALCDVM